MDIDVKHDKVNERFVVIIDGHEVYLSYSLFADKIDLSFVYTPPELRNKGIAAIVVEYALNYAKENNLKVIPSCSYVQAFVKRNDNFNDLLA
jgi:predicted GNAT family acetyltransferase